jgi:ABC-2 type transport system ATP-binding protein
VISVDHLTKNYGPRVAVADVTFDVGKGEVLGFLGPNGAGKTTTMRILTGYLPPSGGRAQVAGFDVATQSLQARARIGYLPETVPLYPDMSVRSYLDFMGKIKGVRDRKREVDRAMEKSRIAHRAGDQIGKLSKGLRQRVGLAQALLGDPPVLILDEPTSGLDPKQIIETRELIKELAGDHTIILSTHILPEVSQTCERVIIINKGHVVAVDTPDNLTKRLRGSETMYVQVDARGADVSAALSHITGVTRVVESDHRDGWAGYEVESERGRDVRRDLARTVVTNGWGLLEMRPMRMSLEEIFLSLTTDEAPAPAPAGETVQ